MSAERERVLRKMADVGWFFNGSDGYTFKPNASKREIEQYLQSTLPRTPIKAKRLKLYTL